MNICTQIVLDGDVVQTASIEQGRTILSGLEAGRTYGLRFQRTVEALSNPSLGRRLEEMAREFFPEVSAPASGHPRKRRENLDLFEPKALLSAGPEDILSRFPGEVSGLVEKAVDDTGEFQVLEPSG